MELQLQFLHLLEAIRNPVFDAFFSLITQLGDETGLIIVGLLFYWCFDKKNAHYLFLVGFVGTTVNQFLKLVFHIPRPWVLDPTLSPIEGALEGAGGFSFPSGHTQSSVGLFGTVALLYKKHKPIFFTAVALCVLIPFSRMYLGVHTPQDVLVSVLVALVLIVSFDALLNLNEKYPFVIYIIIGVMVAAIAAFLVFLYVYPFPEDVFFEENVGNYNSALKNAYTMLGCVLGVLLFRLMDDKVTHYDTKAVWWAQILKLLLGIAIVMAVKEGSKPLLKLIFGGHLASNAVRYFLVVAAATGWTFTFKFWSKLGKKKRAN